MFGVSAFINYTIAVAVWTRFCFHVFLIELFNLRRIPQRYLYPWLGWQVRRRWITQTDQSKASPTIPLHAITGVSCRCSPGSAFDLTGAMPPTMLATDDEMIEIADFAALQPLFIPQRT